VLDDLHRAAARGAGDHDSKRHLRQRRAATRDRGDLRNIRPERQPAQHRTREQRGGGLADGPARPVCELADRACRHAEVGRDPLVALAVERVPHDHLALLGRQRADRADHPAQPLAHLDDLVGPPHTVEALGELVVPGLRIARDVQRRVVRHPVQPRPQDDRRAPARERGVSVDERLLDRVLGRRARQVPAAVAEQRRPVALHDRREALLVTRARERDEALIGRLDEHPRPGAAGELRWVRSRHERVLRSVAATGSRDRSIHGPARASRV
jgi:hypothetical protein